MNKRLLPYAVVASLVGESVLLVACGDDAPRQSFVPTDAGTDVPKAVLPPVPDATIGDAQEPPPPNFDPADEPVTCAAAPCVVELVAGAKHFCARLQDGTIRCWGDNTIGALGAGPDVSADVGHAPLAVAEIEHATQLSAAGDTTCARIDDGSVKCWGSNADGQLGLQASPAISDGDPHATPSAVAVAAAVRVDVGLRSACALGPSGELWCWGSNESKQLARPDAGASIDGPAAADLDGNVVVRTGAGRDSAFAMTNAGALLGWGVISGREASISPDAVPFALPSLADVTSFAVGLRHVCAIASGAVHCWGDSPQGALGTGLPDREKLPVKVHVEGSRSDVFPQQVAVSANSTCVRLTDGSIQCCGDDRTGQLGRGQASTLVPFFGPAAAFTKHAVRVATSDSATCALVQGGTVECWGGNAAGELGQGTHDEDPHAVPVAVAFP